MPNPRKIAPKLLSVEVAPDVQAKPGWKVTFELGPMRAPYAVFLLGGCAEEEIVRLAKAELAAEIAALAKALGA